MKHRGALLLAVLVSLLVATSLLTAIVQSAITHRREIRSLARLAQVELLLQSGLDRAESQLALHPEYLGETWRLDAEAFSGSTEAEHPSAMGGAEITIRIDPGLATQGDRPEVTPVPVATIAVEYPAGQVDSIRRTRRFSLYAR